MAAKKNYKCVKSVEQFYSGGPYSVSPDGSFIACACDETIKIINTSDGSVKSTIESDSTPVTALCISPNSNFLFSSTHSLLIRVWDLTSLQCLRSWKPPIEGHGPISGMACDASGGLLATGGNNGTVMVWDVDGGFSTHYFIGHKTIVSTVMFHSDPTKLLLFSASEDRTARIWDLTTKKSNKKSNKCIASLEKHQSAVTTIGLSEDGWTLLTAGRDKLVYLWDLHDYSLKSSVVVHEAVEAICVIDSMSPFASCLISSVQLLEKQRKGKGIQFITVGERGIVRIWDSNGAACHFEQKSSDFAVGSEAERRGFTSAVMLPSGQGLLTVTADQEFLFYSPAETPDGLNLILSKRLVGYNDEIVDMKFLGEEEQFLAVATSVEQVRVYDLVSMSCSYVLAGHTNIVLSLDTCLSTSGRTLIVTGSKDNTVRLWDTDSKGCIGVGVGHLGAVGAVAFSKKSRNFFVSGSTDCTLKVWSFDSLLNEGDSNLKVKAAVASHDKDINAIAIAPNDSLVCSGSQDRTACIRRLPNLVSVTVLRGHKRGIWSVEFSPVDQCVITASGDKTVKIWAISDGSCLKTFEGHTSSVLRAFFVTRGSQFVSCGADGLVKLWTVKTNECIATYDQHEDKIWALAVGKKTEMLATGGGDAVVNLWHDSTTADKEEEFRKEEESVLRGQELENAVSDADYTRAIQIAFELRRPHKLFDLFSQLCSKRDAEHQIEKALSGLEKEKWHLLLEYVREWNIKPKLCHIAQFVLFRIFRILPPTEIVEIKGIGELLEGLIPYSQRHFSRIDRLERSTYLLDYTLTGMSVIEPHAELVPGGNATKQIKDSNDGGVVDFAEEVRDQGVVEAEVNVSSKKRKSKGAKDVAHKKKKGVAYVNVSTIRPCSRVLKEKESK